MPKKDKPAEPVTDLETAPEPDDKYPDNVDPPPPDGVRVSARSEEAG